MAKEFAAETVVSILDPDMRAPRFQDVTSLCKHMAFYCWDQETTLPTGMQDAVTDLILLGQSWQKAQKFPNTIVHCHAEVSRSTAATYVLLCAAFPNISPKTHFETLLQLTRKPWPNERIVIIADGLLAAKGELLSPLNAYRDANPKRLAVYRRFNRRRGIVDKVQR